MLKMLHLVRFKIESRKFENNDVVDVFFVFTTPVISIVSGLVSKFWKNWDTLSKEC